MRTLILCQSTLAVILFSGYRSESTRIVFQVPAEACIEFLSF
jgi:hypothetical protein